MDVLNVIDVDQVNLELCDELSPGVLKPKLDADAAAAGGKYTAVIMPMRI